MKWILCLFLIACGGQYHVQLPAPSPTITPQERVAMFWRMIPAKEGTESVNGDVVNDTIMLGDNQTEVVCPEDLEPLVGSDSDTMRYARASIHARNKSELLFKLSFSMAAAGLIAGFGFGDGRPAVAIAGASLFVLAFVPYFMEKHYTHKEIGLRRKAFAAYPADLGRRLDVCAHGNEVVPCEGPLPGQPPGEKLPPATTVPARTGSLRMREDDLLGAR